MSRPSAPTPSEAVATQRDLAQRVVRERDFREPETIAGVDVSVRNERATAAVVVLRYPSLERIEARFVTRAIEFPYVPGLLGFREIPVLTEAFARLATQPDLILVDGHGLAHPRRFGIACHLGVTLDVPSIGCGKSRLVGDHREPAAKRGRRTRLLHRGEVIGTVLRTRERVRPMFVSIGHRIDLESAVRFVLACGRGYRLPEPTRIADREAGRVSRERSPRRRHA